jgi:circadian clock protein KaiC
MPTTEDRVRTGVPGLDEVLEGGLTKGAIHLVEGESGNGKTLLGLHFSLEGLRLGETVLYMALSETRGDLEMVARSHRWDIGKLNIIEAASAQERPSSLFHPAEVELGQAVENLKEAVDRVNPARLVVDSLSEFRILGQSSPRYRRELLAVKRYLVARGCTVLLLDIDPGDDDSQRSLVDGVILLESSAPIFGKDRRKMRILKLRGRSYAGGYHDFIIEHGGLLSWTYPCRRWTASKPPGASNPSCPRCASSDCPCSKIKTLRRALSRRARTPLFLKPPHLLNC